MNKDRVEGAAKNIKGKAKTAAGKVLGDEKLKNEKKFEKWTYTVAKWTLDNLLKERKDFLAEKKEEPKPGDAPKPTATPPGE